MGEFAKGLTYLQENAKDLKTACKILTDNYMLPCEYLGYASGIHYINIPHYSSIQYMWIVDVIDSFAEGDMYSLKRFSPVEKAGIKNYVYAEEAKDSAEKINKQFQLVTSKWL